MAVEGFAALLALGSGVRVAAGADASNRRTDEPTASIPRPVFTVQHGRSTQVGRQAPYGVLPKSSNDRRSRYLAVRLFAAMLVA